MQNKHEAVLAFPVQHSIFIPQDQNEIEQIDEIELTPNIQIEEVADEVIVSGYLKLAGTYTGRPPRFPDIPENEDGVPLTGYVDSVVFNPFAMDPDDFTVESEVTPFEQKIPVYIRIARDKISAMDDLYAGISAFDYDIPSARKVTITAELALNGVRQAGIKQQPEPKMPLMPISFEYTVPIQEAETVSAQNESIQEAEPEVKPELVSFTPESEVAEEAESEVKPEPVAFTPEPEEIEEAEPEVKPEPVTFTPEPEAVEEAEPEVKPEPVTFTPEPEAAEETEPEVKPEPVVFTPEPEAAPAPESTSLRPEAKQVQKVEERKEPETAKIEPVTKMKSEPVEEVREEKKEIKATEEEQTEDVREEIAVQAEVEVEPEVEEKQEDAKVSITLKGTKRDPVTVTTNLLTSFAANAEAAERANEAVQEAERVVVQETEAQIVEEKTPRTLREDALYLTNFMNKAEETFTRLKMCIAQKDETLEEIAERYNITAGEVAEANGLHTNATVTRGQVLYIPVKG